MPLKLSRAGSFAFFGGNNNRNGGRNNFTTSSSDITTSIPRQDKTNNNDSFNTAGHNKITAPSKPSQVIPLKRRSISIEVNPQLSTKNINIGSKRLGKENTPYPKSVWYKSIFGRLNQTFKWNTSSIQQQKADSEEKHFRSLKISKAVLTTDKDNEQLLVIKKDNLPTLYRDTTPIPSIPLSTGDSTTPTSRSNRRTSSLFEICAQTPRHNTSEAEVLGKVGRFTIVRERKDFNTTIFDQCHCAVKPCPYAESTTHPPAEAVVFSSDTSYCNSSSCSLPIKIHSHPYNQRHSSPTNPKPSIVVASTNGPSQRHSAHITGSSYNNSNNVQAATIPLQSLVTEQQRKENHSTSFMKSISAPVISASNITTIAPLSKSENNSLTIFQSQNLYQLRHSSLPATKNESNSDIETNNTATNGTTTTNLPNTKPSRFIVHKLSNSSLNSDNSSTPTNSIPPTAQLTPTLSSHATINSISGRKFEVEWSTDLTRVSPSSTISSIVSYAASISAQSSTSFTPSSSLSSRGSLGKGSILNGKGGRKFEVTPLERDSAGVNDVVI